MAESSRRQGEITHALGLHLRTATRFVQLSRRFRAQIRVSCNGRVADGGSILDLMMLAAGCGDRLELEATGPDAEDAIVALWALIEEELREDADNRCPKSQK